MCVTVWQNINPSTIVSGPKSNHVITELMKWFTCNAGLTGGHPAIDNPDIALWRSFLRKSSQSMRQIGLNKENTDEQVVRCFLNMNEPRRREQ